MLLFKTKQKSRRFNSYWKKKPVFKNKQVSIAFTWHVPLVLQYIDNQNGWKLGGPAVKLLQELRPQLIPSDLVKPESEKDWLIEHNPYATRTSIGCVRNCEFCAVPIIEPCFKEFSGFIPRPLIIDNNFLATSKKHIVRVVDKLSGIREIDFCQGLDARLLKPWHIEQFQRLHWSKIRFAWDSADQEDAVMDAIRKLKQAGVTRRTISVYVLVGFKESFDEAWYRCSKLYDEEGVFPFAMRYQPLDALRFGEFCPPQWNPHILQEFCRYWNLLTRVGRRVPFDVFCSEQKKPSKSLLG